MDRTEAEDWFVVSGVLKGSDVDAIDSFEFDSDKFIVAKAQQHKCPRCWKYRSKDENSLCPRCQEVVEG